MKTGLAMFGCCFASTSLIFLVSRDDLTIYRQDRGDDWYAPLPQLLRVIRFDEHPDARNIYRNGRWNSLELNRWCREVLESVL